MNAAVGDEAGHADEMPSSLQAAIVSVGQDTDVVRLFVDRRS